MIYLSFDVGIKNLAYCQIDTSSEEKNNWNIVDWNVLDCSATNYVLKIIEELDNIPNLLDSDIILIEKQPSCNPKMRIISTVIYVYFTIRIQYENQKKIKLMYYSPKYKLRCCDEKFDIKVKSKYAYNKKLGIEHTKVFLKESPFLIYFLSHKKKDDLADSFLQGLSYILFFSK